MCWPCWGKSPQVNGTCVLVMHNFNVCLAICVCTWGLHYDTHKATPPTPPGLCSKQISPSIYSSSIHHPSESPFPFSRSEDWPLRSIFRKGLHLPLLTSICQLFPSVSVPGARQYFWRAHQNGWGEMIWLMPIASLSIHDYFLESIRLIWLIQVVALIKGLPLSLHFHFSIALAFHFLWIRSLSSLLPSVRLSCTHFTTACFSWLEETDHTHLDPPSSASNARESLGDGHPL